VTLQRITASVATLASVGWVFLLGCLFLVQTDDNGVFILVLLAFTGMVILTSVSVYFTLRNPLGHRERALGAGLMGANGVFLLVCLRVLWGIWFPLDEAAEDLAGSVLTILVLAPVAVTGAASGLMMFALAGKTND